MGNKIWSNKTQSYQRMTDDGKLLTEYVCHHIAPGVSPWRGTSSWIGEAENEQELSKIFLAENPGREIYKISTTGRSTIRQWETSPDIIPTTVYGYGNPNEDEG